MLAEHELDSEETDLNCAACGNERIVVDPDGTAACPDCRETYALVVHDEFALIETGGWTTRVTLEPSGEMGTGRAN